MTTRVSKNLQARANVKKPNITHCTVRVLNELPTSVVNNCLKRLTQKLLIYIFHTGIKPTFLDRFYIFHYEGKQHTSVYFFPKYVLYVSNTIFIKVDVEN